jgi:hypothetical protein
MGMFGKMGDRLSAWVQSLVTAAGIISAESFARTLVDMFAMVFLGLVLG